MEYLTGLGFTTQIGYYICISEVNEMKKHIRISISMILAITLLLVACSSNNGSPATDNTSPSSITTQTDDSPSSSTTQTDASSTSNTTQTVASPSSNTTQTDTLPSSNTTQTGAPPTSSTTQTDASPLSNTTQPDASESANYKWVYLSDSVDFDGMNLYWQLDRCEFAADKNAILSLYVEAGVDDDDRFQFDDGQNWLLVMKTSMGYYELLPRQYVQLGYVSVMVYNGWNEVSSAWDITHVIVTVAEGAALQIYNMIFDNELKAFRIEPILRASNINFNGSSG